MDNSKRGQLQSLLLGGVLPLVVYTIIEEYFGVFWGLIAGMALGIGEIVFERVRQGKVETITWVGNGLILGLGLISLFTQEGFWFRMQPAILELGMAGLLIGSWATQRSFLLLMARKQGAIERMPPALQPEFESFVKGFTVRLGVFFLLHSLLATWAAFYWSTRAWVLLKGVGFTGSMIAYGAVEVLCFRRRLSRKIRFAKPSPPGVK